MYRRGRSSCANSSMEQNGQIDLKIVQCGGESMVHSRPCFDPTNKYLFCCGGRTVRVIETETGECVQRLDHGSDVVCALIDEENIAQLLTCTVDGVVSQWTYEDGMKIKDWSIAENVQVYSFIVPKRPPATWYIVASIDTNKSHLYMLTRTKEGLSRKSVVKMVEDPRILAIHDSGSFAAFVAGRKIWIKDLKDDHASPRRLTDPEQTVNLVVCHPTNDSVATADELGRIYVWHKVMGRRPVYTIYHWHSLPLSDIAFSREGTAMYSGGEEMVVVRWSFHSSSKEQSKDFLPRTGAKIEFLATSPDSALVAVSLQDNSIQIASSQLKVISSIQGFAHNFDNRSAAKGAEEQQADQVSGGQMRYPAGLVFDSDGCGGEITKGTLVTNGRPGYLQFYDARKDRQRINLDVIGKNQPPAERGRRLSYFEVVRIALCRGWLATIDHRSDRQYSDETNLKFWKYDEESKGYVAQDISTGLGYGNRISIPALHGFKLNTWVDRPHAGVITSLFFRPCINDKEGELALLSTGDDGKFKAWELTVDASIYGSKEVWSCERAGYYRGQPASCGDFSADGVLSIGFGHTATFWNFEEHRMTAAISVLSEDNVIRKLQFGIANMEKQLIAVLSDQNLAVWDVSAQVCLWRVAAKPDVVCKDPSSGVFAAFFGPKFCAFRLSSPKPVTVMDSKDFKSVISAAFAPGLSEKENGTSEEMSPLYFITDDQRLMCLRRSGTEDVDDSKVNTKLIILYKNARIRLQEPSPNDASTRTPFAELLAASKASKQKDTRPSRHATYETNLQLLAGSSHTLPSVATIGPRFAESCLAKKEPTKNYEDVVFPDIASEITFASLRKAFDR